MTALCIPEEVAARGPRAVALYKQIIANGETERWATMCALQSPPGSRNTDRAFSQSQVRKMNRMPKQNRDKIIAIAKQAGINTENKFYVGALGKYGDPKAWVSSAEDVITSCKEQNCGVNGVLNFNAPHTVDIVPPARKALSDELVAEMSVKEMRADPALAEKVRKNPKVKRELREKVIDKYGKKKR